MAEERNDMLFTVSGFDLVYLVSQQERITSGDLLANYLKFQGYENVATDLYRKGSEEEIKLFTDKTEQRYLNLRKPNDTGNMIQFLMNRLGNDGEVKVNDDLERYCLAVVKCLDFESSLLTQNKKIKKPRIVKRATSREKKL